jgi:hypothetical protein
MKTLLSIFALTLALAFTGPAFAEDVTAAKTEELIARMGWELICACELLVSGSSGKAVRAPTHEPLDP